MTVILGCATAIGKRARRPIEVWLVDYQDFALYRVTVDNKEKYIPIKNNEKMRNFLCLHSDDFYLMSAAYSAQLEDEEVNDE